MTVAFNSFVIVYIKCRAALNTALHLVKGDCIMKEGMRYVIEIEEVYVSAHAGSKPERLYRVKGFNSLVFDEEGLKKLIPYERYKIETLTDVIKSVIDKE